MEQYEEAFSRGHHTTEDPDCQEAIELEGVEHSQRKAKDQRLFLEERASTRGQGRVDTQEFKQSDKAAQYSPVVRKS